MNCPFCDSEDFELLVDEVDIGVGEQTRVYGGECKQCGQLSICSDCKAWEDKDGNCEHATWCGMLRIGDQNDNQ